MAQTPESKDKTENGPITPIDNRIRHWNVGIWKVASLRKDYWWNRYGGIINGLTIPQIAQKIKSIRESASVLIRLMRDIWGVAPIHLMCWFGFTFVASTETAINLYVSTYTLEMVCHLRDHCQDAGSRIPIASINCGRRKGRLCGCDAMHIARVWVSRI